MAISEVRVGDKIIGDRQPAYVIAEIGINHNGSIELAKKLTNIAYSAGCDAVKFQKRTIDIVYTPDELAKPRESPFGETNGDLKRGLEFSAEQYATIDQYCKTIGITWFASCWDEPSVDIIDAFDPPCYKIASAAITDENLLRHAAAKGKPILMSTGMSTLAQIDRAVEILGVDHLVLFHTCSTYPSSYKDLNLKVISTLKDRYSVPVGYSGHETGLASSSAAVALGACAIERHITLDRAMWGSDQAASLEPNGINKLVRDIRLVEEALGSPEKVLLPCEEPMVAKLRRVGR